MTRKEEREEAFKLVFEAGFHMSEINDVLENARDGRDLEISEDSFTYRLASKTIENLGEIDAVIGKCSKNWKPDRMAKTSLAILRIAVCEMYYFDDIPDSVSINEAVELAKIYCGEDDPSFINGVLGAVEKNK